MKLCDFPLLSTKLVRFSCDHLTGKWHENEEVSLIANGEDYLIKQGDWVCAGKVIGSDSNTAIRVQRGLTLWLLRNQHEKTLQLQALDLVERIQLSMAISVDEAMAEQLQSKGEISKPEIDLAIAWLSDHFLSDEGMPGNNNKRMFIGRFENASDGRFLIFGKGWRGQVRRDNDTLKLISITRLGQVNAKIAMIEGALSFHDASVAVLLQSAEQRALLDAALRDNGSYLRLWQEYSKLEWEQAKARASELGSLRFFETKQNEGEIKSWFLTMDVDQLKAFKQRWRDLSLSRADQVELGEKTLDLDIDVVDAKKKLADLRQRPIRGKIEFKSNGVIFKPSQNMRSDRPPEKGYLYYSLSGDETVQARRNRAKQSIDDGRRLPQLRYLLEGVAPPMVRRRSLEGLSPYARACFKGPPTSSQQKAVDRAINTPDIAIIVGPPGTGKTQVIAALQRRLAETLGTESLQHQVLISSYQHDAVDNALNRAEVFGLPAVRIGGRIGSNEGGVDPVGIWCERKRKEISVQLDTLKLNDPLNQPLADLAQSLISLRLSILSPQEQYEQFGKVDILLQKLEKLGLRLPSALRERWGDYLAQQHHGEAQRSTASSNDLLRLVRSLRTTHEGFEDDGSDRVHQLFRTLLRFGIKLGDAERLMLDRLSAITNVTDDDLVVLAKFKDDMFDRLKPDYRPPILKQALRGDVLEIFSEIEQAIEKPLSQSRRGIPSVVARYHAALAQAPYEAEQAVREYASIVGATCQQAAGKAMSSLKALSDLDATEGIEFDTVVVDEAARANPLDLFVPMAMARRRIILVGDHRQLPHLVQRELEEELITSQNLSDAQAKAYEQSLFERLVKQLRAQEKVDNIERVVMLDTQFRMHPTLGDFISQQFYEPEGLGILHSGRPTSDFAHTVPGYEDKCAAWIDVPLQDGKEDKKGTSRIRNAEADRIAAEVKRIADACGSSISIGVISFYRAQSDLILQALLKYGLAEEDDGEIRIARAYRQTDSGEERLRVGTVDAFQGKEFDVVFLSVVRANDKVIPIQKQGDEREKLLINKYGHLRLANRLNVAMSRQRKLLIVVGNKRMAEGVESEEAVPALAAFLKLCQKEALSGG